MDVAFFLASRREEKGLEGFGGRELRDFPGARPGGFPESVLWGSENEVENSVEKVFPKGPQMDPKSCQKST